MTRELDYKNNPLHGVSLKTLLTEIIDYYGFDILFAYLNINCFASNPSIESSVKFLKKTDWAREKVEAFYLYQFKSLPRASAEQFELPPRDRIVPPDQKPGQAAELSLEDAERLRENVASLIFTESIGKHFKLTISIGAASKKPELLNSEMLLQLADKRLYMAKENGRNRTVAG